MAEAEGGLNEAHICTDVSLSEGPLPYAVSHADGLRLVQFCTRIINSRC